MLRSGLQNPESHESMWRTLLATGYWPGEVWNRRKNGEVYPRLLNLHVSALTPMKQVSSSSPPASGKMLRSCHTTRPSSCRFAISPCQMRFARRFSQIAA